MVDLRNITTFYWVATLGGFHAAAEKLHTTQPTISQRIQSLEESLGVRLFERDNRGIALTVKGIELLPIAERMLRTRSELMQAAREDNVIRGTLRLGVSETVVHTWLPRLMEYLHETYPALLMDIQVDTSTLLKEQINGHQLDLAFLLGPMTEPHVQNLDLCEYPLHWLASPRLNLGRGPVPLKRLGDWPIITYPASTDPHKEVQKRMRAVGVDPVRMYGSAALSVIVRMAQDGIGTAVVALVTAQRALEDGSLIALDVDAAPLPPLRYTACWRTCPTDVLPRVVAQAAQRIAREDAATV
ncbi:HTH-type transcriptional regulator YofA [mine drainage metagenome]|uniref:HTH-type transcriptional regulator YofA n=1 Tax=mine drainage metagenome TaxID=410659 RepID=A0A1J5R770_9ZZZZ